MRGNGFKIHHVGFDPKFGQTFIPMMESRRFRMVETPQRVLIKSQGFRRIEVQAKKKKFYYLHSEAYEYCLKNVKGIEAVDDAIKYEKISYNRRIDLFDASVFAAYEMEKDLKHRDSLKNYWSS